MGPGISLHSVRSILLLDETRAPYEGRNKMIRENQNSIKSAELAIHLSCILQICEVTANGGVEPASLRVLTGTEISPSNHVIYFDCLDAVMGNAKG